ncbi:transcription factor SPT20 homolog [Leguminivora glycinivorella]|uniref:transcription factor SPT20 homolog n=1 Tax=Leguminivora glycinivorella TaxID=1035111 RepID=UPI00200FA4FA|nr:transcription factor SPT20 homolog [Leguminivora glycinivorella]
MYLTPSQIKKYEAGHGLPPMNFEQQALLKAQYEQEQTTLSASTFAYTPQNPATGIPLNGEEGKVVQNTFDILEANEMQLHLAQQTNANLEMTRAEENHVSHMQPVEVNTENEDHVKVELLKQQQQQQQKQQLLQQVQKQQQQQQLQQHRHEQQPEENKLIEHAATKLKDQNAYIHAFSNQMPESLTKNEILHSELHSVNLDEEIRQGKEKNIEIQQDPFLDLKFNIFPYENMEEKNVQQKLQGLNQIQQQTFLSTQEPWRPIVSPLNENDQQYASYTSSTKNMDPEKILQESKLERESSRIHAENIAKSPPVVIHKDIRLIRRNPLHVINMHVNIPFPLFIPVPKNGEVRHFIVPIVKSETVEVEKPVLYAVEKPVRGIVGKKVYIPVDKLHTVKRIVPVEVRKENPAELVFINRRRLRYDMSGNNNIYIF